MNWFDDAPRSPKGQLLPKLTERQRRALNERYQAGGETVMELAAEYEVTERTIYRMVKQKNRCRTSTPEERRQVALLYAGGMSMAAVARKLGRSQNFVKAVLLVTGVKIRTWKRNHNWQYPWRIFR